MGDFRRRQWLFFAIFRRMWKLALPPSGEASRTGSAAAAAPDPAPVQRQSRPAGPHGRFSKSDPGAPATEAAMIPNLTQDRPREPPFKGAPKIFRSFPAICGAEARRRPPVSGMSSPRRDSSSPGLARRGAARKNACGRHRA